MLLYIGTMTALGLFEPPHLGEQQSAVMPGIRLPRRQGKQSAVMLKGPFRLPGIL